MGAAAGCDELRSSFHPREWEADMRKLFPAIIGLVTALGIASAGAQTYPSRPITLLVPFAAGGPADALARALGERMRASLGQTVIIENATGASGPIGVGRVVRAPPDGYTLGIGHVGTHVVNGAIFALPFDLLKDLEPVALLPSNSLLIITKKTFPANDLKELIAWLKANPGKASAGTSGAGGGSHVNGVYFQNLTDTRFQFVPYRGTGPALTDLIAGQIDLMFDQASNSLGQVRAGTIKAYAVTAKARLPSAPDIPTVDEAGLPGFYTSTWYGMWAPKGTPKPVIAKLSAAVMEALADPVVQKRLGDQGLEFPLPAEQTPEALAAHHKAEIEKWWPIVKAANIKPE
jgi:tripartite-type tricarboxylate transporter receptor subunit TctC